MGARTLLVSNDNSLRESIAQAMASTSDSQLQFAATLSEARSFFHQSQPAVVFYHVSDQQKYRDAATFLEEVSTEGRSTHLVALADQRDASLALTLMRAGAADYMVRPLNLTRLTMLTDVLSLRSGSRTKNARARKPVEAIGPERDFLYASPAMKELVNRVQRVASLDSTVLLSGETGSGKTRVARLIHELSDRADEPFVCVNCGALAPSLIESELFGHVRGAFTGADRDRAGKCATAGAGTLLLDEVDSLPLATQSKLLRAVDERLFEPVGSDQSLRLNARLVVATNRSLEEEVHCERFRADLFYRINVLALQLPPLRERREDIASIAAASNRHFAASMGNKTPGIAPEAIQAMQQYDWPGNIRELQNVIQRAVAFGSNRIELADLPDALQSTKAATNGQQISGHSAQTACGNSKWVRSRSEAESQVITAALSKNANNRSRAARELGISRVTLYKKLHKYGLI
jgi:DNA-binding NtrC family response regulator